MERDEIHAIADAFAKEWTGKGNEKQDTQAFWLGILQKIFGVGFAMDYIEFEKKVETDGHIKYIDAYIPDTKVLIEQKSVNIDLDAAERQSDGEMLTPFQQAKRYSDWLGYGERAKWIIVSNFKEFRIYDMNFPSVAPIVIKLEDFGEECEKLRFIYNRKEEFLPDQKKISEAAGEIVGKLYDALREGFADPDDSKSLESLNILCVRLVFLLYAEDSSLLLSDEIRCKLNRASQVTRNQFRRYLDSFSTEGMRDGLVKLFDILNTPYDKRSKNERKDLLEFVYVNGGLFSKEFDTDLPQFTEKSRNILINECSRGFDWRGISPTVFGAVFESTLDPKTRRKQGMHYTSPENIHKAIDPLLLDELKAELDTVYTLHNTSLIYKSLLAFQEKLAELTFLDPACGSGNFLTETYISLRNLENDMLKSALHFEKMMCEDEFDGLPRVSQMEDPVKVKISNFYGIEIEPFAVTVAKTALWIAEMRMKYNTENMLCKNLNYFPISSYSHIKRANALHIDWNTFEGNMTLFSEDADDTTERPPRDYDYIIGNPPFVGHQYRTKEQTEDMDFVFAGFNNYGKLDYVSCWYKKTADIVKGKKTRCAFVSTNSICQGESVAIMWRPLFEKYNLQIDFAWRTFVWESKSFDMAHVNCVVIGFSCSGFDTERIIIDEKGERHSATYINGYLNDASDFFIQSRGKNLTEGLPPMHKGSQPTDGGYLILSESERNELIEKYPVSKKWIRRFMMGEDFLNYKVRYCLWLVNAKQSELNKCPLILDRIEKVKKTRKNSVTEALQKFTAHSLFSQIRQPKTEYLAIPCVSSENRDYIPMAFLSPKIIAGNKLQVIEGASLYIFAVLTSNVHNAWMRVTAGRLEMRYSYSPAVYNNFPWCDATEEQKKEIERTAQEILDVRKKHKDMTLAQMYNKETMPEDLREAHRRNDVAVMRAYGFEEGMAESEIVGRLMEVLKGKLKG